MELTSEAAHKTGVWACTAGSYERQVVNAELMHILSGRCTFTPTGGEALHIQAGDTVFYPAHTTGRWDMFETLCKVYVVFPRGLKRGRTPCRNAASKPHVVRPRAGHLEQNYRATVLQ